MFSNIKEFINSLIDNEGIVHIDNYGREWTYKGEGFYFKGLNGNTSIGLFNCHLYDTEIRLIRKNSNNIKGENYE